MTALCRVLGRSVSSLWGAWESVRRVVLRLTLLGALRGGAEGGRWHAVHLCVGVLGLVRSALWESQSVCGCVAGPFVEDNSCSLPKCVVVSASLICLGCLQSLLAVRSRVWRCCGAGLSLCAALALRCWRWRQARCMWVCACVCVRCCFDVGCWELWVCVRVTRAWARA